MSGPPIKKEAPGRQAQAPIKPNDSTPRIEYWSQKSKPVPFGPFLEVEPELLKPAGWTCPKCSQAVRRLGIPVPYLSPRMMIYACKCVTVACFEDESQASSELWLDNIDLARATGTKMLIFNGGKPTPAGFQGIN